MQNDKLVEALEPCPLCGMKADLWRAHPDRPARKAWIACTGRCCIMTREYLTDEEAIAAWNRRATLSRSDDGAGEAVSGWIISNGQDDRWRTWKDGYSAWTDNREEATRYARREDAEAVHGHDEEAWHVKPYALAHPPAAVAGEGAKYAELSTDEKAVAMANDCVGDPWELLGYFRTKLEQAERESIEWKERAMSLRLSQPAADAAHPPADAAAVAGEGLSLVKARKIVDTVTEFCRGADFSCDMKAATKAILPLLKALSPTHPTPDTIGSHYGNGGRFDLGAVKLRDDDIERIVQNAFTKLKSENVFYGRPTGSDLFVAMRYAVQAALSTLTRTDEASTDGEGRS